TQETRLRVASNPMRGWQANKRRTCALPVVLGLCPKRKNHPLCGWIFIERVTKMKKVYKKLTVILSVLLAANTVFAFSVGAIIFGACSS
ncbi:MAG: hypothetical protein IKJ27_11140, partial [Clostridia bacterium]|nr:hypothetical protein [Clostridia bacterium]